MVQTAFKLILNQKATEDMEQFRREYNELLDYIDPFSKKIYTVSPLILGEDLKNIWNESLKILSEEIKKISKKSKNITYIDLQKTFYDFLESKDPTDYIIETKGLLRDYLAKSHDNIDKTSKIRGLHLTIDGAHLNNIGAKIVADTFYNIITGEKK